FPPGRGLATTDHMLEVLAGVRPCRDKPFRALRDAVLERSASLSGAVAVLLAWDAPRRDFVRRLRVLGIPTRAFVVGDGTTPAGGPGDQVQHLAVGRNGEGPAQSRPRQSCQAPTRGSEARRPGSPPPPPRPPP